jgi:two-component sensor histidine kinase/Tfp pilus assembly protein PilF
LILNKTLLALLVGFSFVGQTQISTIDSLKIELGKASASIKQGEICIQLSEAFGNLHPDSVIYYSLKAKKIIKQSKYPYHKKAVVITATAYNNVGFACSMQGKLSEALKYHRKALKLWEGMGNEENSSKAFNNIGVLYRLAGDFRMAEVYFNKALKILKRQSDTLGVALCLNNLGGIYKEQDNFTKALESYEVALKLRTIMNEQNGRASTLNNIGALYKMQNNLDSALFYFQRSLDLCKKLNNTHGISHASWNLAGIKLQLGDVSAAKVLGELSLKTAQEIKSVTNINQSVELLTKIYTSLRDWENASKMQALFIENSEKIKQEEFNRELIKSEYKSEYEKQVAINKKEIERKLAEKTHHGRIRNYFLGGSVLFLVVFIVFALILKKRLKTLKEQKEIIEKQNNEGKGMLQEIHHRVKNNFQIISSLLRLQTYNENNPSVNNAFQGAINRIHAMSVVHEIIYKQGSFSGMSAKRYLESLVENLKQSLPNDRLIIDVEAFENELEMEQFIPIGIIINELITNSYQHAFAPINEEPRIAISLAKEGNKVQLIYKDNGVGFTKRQNESSFGMDLIETMVEQISGQITKISEDDWNTIFIIQFAK